MIKDQDTLQKSVMLLMAKYELFDSDIIWDINFKFLVICNDLFWWGTADAEELNISTIKQLEQALKDAGGIDGCDLYCCRMRKMRPQGACYKYIEEKNWSLFNKCGPERETGFGNPESVKEKDLCP